MDTSFVAKSGAVIADVVCEKLEKRSVSSHEDYSERPCTLIPLKLLCI